MNKTVKHEEICNKLNEIYKKKNADYGDSFSKARKEISTYTLCKLYDKYERFKQLTITGKNEVKDETIEDTLYDLANYAILELIEREIDEI